MRCMNEQHEKHHPNACDEFSLDKGKKIENIFANFKFLIVNDEKKNQFSLSCVQLKCENFNVSFYLTKRELKLYSA